MVDALIQDIRYAFRHLVRSPGFAIASILTLALGIGANTAMFSALNALVLRSLPISDPASLVGVSAVNSRGQSRLTLITAIDVLEQERGPLTSYCAYSTPPVIAVEANGISSQAAIEFVTDGCLPMLGIQPILGRHFTREEAAPPGRAANVALIGYQYWERMFGADPNAVGRTLRTEGGDIAIIGVLPRGFSGLQVDTTVDVMAPWGTIIANPPNRAPGTSQLLARLQKGSTIEQARAHLSARWPAVLDAIVPAALPNSVQRDFKDVTVRVQPFGRGMSNLRDRYSRPLTIILGLTGLLLALACINVGGLLLSRLSARRPELAMRRALGASRARLLQQLMAESVIIGLAGAACAIPLAWATAAALSRMLPTGLLDRFVSLMPDMRVLAMTTLVGAGIGVLMNILPVALIFKRPSTVATTDRTIAHSTSWSGRAIVVAQVSISIVLLVGATLLARSLYRLMQIDVGFNTEHIVQVRVMPVPGGYRKFDEAAYYPMLVERLSALPGVNSVGYARVFSQLVDDGASRQPVAFVGAPDGDATAVFDITSPGLFEMLGIRLIEGRLTNWSDNAKSRPVAVVTESLARALDLSGRVVGRHMRFGSDPARKDIEIVGVVANSSVGSLRSTAPPVMYRPALQEGRFGFYPLVFIAAQGDLSTIAEPVRQTIRAMGREYVHEIVPLRQRLLRSAAGERLSATLSIVIAAIAVLLAFVGIYALLAYTVSRRTREIGIRVAIGAAPRDVLGMVVREAVVLTTVGVAIGIPLAVAASGLVASLLFGVSRSDPMTLIACAVFFILLGVAAGLQPARRALGVQPMEALRSE